MAFAFHGCGGHLDQVTTIFKLSFDPQNYGGSISNLGSVDSVILGRGERGGGND